MKIRIGIEYEGVEGWTRINSVPGKEKFFEGEFAPYSDFSGYTDLNRLADAIETAAKEAGIESYDKVYPIIDHGYQFAVSLAVYH